MLDELLYSALLGDLRILGEAMNRILQTETAAPFAQPNWQAIVDFGNIVRYEYFNLHSDEVYRIIKKELPVLEKEIITLFTHLLKEKAMQLDFEDTLNELENMERNESVNYLKLLKKTVEKK